PAPPRKLLLHRSEIRELSQQVSAKGLTLVPLRLYLTRGLAKVELGLARGKRRHDKRRTIIDRERKREAERAIKRRL
ncbi:SsrA-binding protein, partial [Geodia barretti]